MTDFSTTEQGRAYLAEQKQRDIAEANRRAVDHFRARFPALKDKRWFDKVNKATAEHDWAAMTPEQQIALLDSVANQTLEQQQEHARRRTAREIVKARQAIHRNTTSK